MSKLENLDDMPQTPHDIGLAFAEAKRIFSNLKEHNSRGVLLCLSSELRKWEWSVAMSEIEQFTDEEEGLRTCLTCGMSKQDALEAAILED